jgi:hypothetical protein
MDADHRHALVGLEHQRSAKSRRVILVGHDGWPCFAIVQSFLSITPAATTVDMKVTTLARGRGTHAATHRAGYFALDESSRLDKVLLTHFAVEFPGGK